MTLKSGGENSALHRRDKVHFKITNRKPLFYPVIIFHNITVFVMKINASVGEH